MRRSSSFLSVFCRSSDCLDSLTELILRARLCIAPSALTRYSWSGWSPGVFSTNLYKCNRHVILDWTFTNEQKNRTTYFCRLKNCMYWNQKPEACHILLQHNITAHTFPFSLLLWPRQSCETRWWARLW